MFFNYICDTLGNMFVNTKPSQILPLVTLHKSRPSSLSYQLSFEGVRKGAPRPWSWALLVLLFMPKSKHSSFIALWENGNLPLQVGEILGGNKETALPGVGRRILASLDHSVLGEEDVAGNPAPTLLEPGLREQTTTP